MLTTGLEHGCERGARGRRGGEVTVVISGDGLIGQVGGALAGTGGDARACIPGGRGNDLARVLGIPTEVDGRGRSLLAGGAPREIDVGEVNGKRFLCIASCGFDSDANRIANEAKLVRGNLVYAYAALRALVGWKPATFTLTPRRRRAEAAAGTRSRSRTARPTAAACSSPPTPSSTTACSTSSRLAEVGKLRFLTHPAEGVRRHPRR